MSKAKTVFICQECGHQSPRWLGKCPGCNGWNTVLEERQSANLIGSDPMELFEDEYKAEAPSLLKDVELDDKHRYKVGIDEFDRVLGGGIVKGSVTLIAGEPGIGKSTLLLQVSGMLNKSSAENVFYVSGEESTKQTKLRSSRLSSLNLDNIYITNETNLDTIIEYIKKLSSKVVIIDSIQVVYDPAISSGPGSVSQVKECAGRLTMLAKKMGVSLFIVGHITKDGAIAGPRLLEHMVDTVLYFEGERSATFRILRAAKNRFGSTNEIGIFEMTDMGLIEVDNPSRLFLGQRPHGISGSCVTSTIEGTRSILVEAQALVTPVNFGLPRRQASGFDCNRLNLIAAVLEKRVGLGLFNSDIYLNIAGGIKVEEPAADLAIGLAIASNLKNSPIKNNLIAFGEMGLGGEIRGVAQSPKRIDEALRMGFEKIILPKSDSLKLKDKYRTELIGVNYIGEALEEALH